MEKFLDHTDSRFGKMVLLILLVWVIVSRAFVFLLARFESYFIESEDECEDEEALRGNKETRAWFRFFMGFAVVMIGYIVGTRLIWGYY